MECACYGNKIANRIKIESIFGPLSLNRGGNFIGMIKLLGKLVQRKEYWKILVLLYFWTGCWLSCKKRMKINRQEKLTIGRWQICMYYLTLKTAVLVSKPSMKRCKKKSSFYSFKVKFYNTLRRIKWKSEISWNTTVIKGTSVCFKEAFSSHQIYL